MYTYKTVFYMSKFDFKYEHDPNSCINKESKYKGKKGKAIPVPGHGGP
jgi:hypothetical protein